jgi:hypothetical protein
MSSLRPERARSGELVSDAGLGQDRCGGQWAIGGRQLAYRPHDFQQEMNFELPALPPSPVRHHPGAPDRGEPKQAPNFGRSCRPDLAMPEPASWALMIGGLGLVGASLRHRRGTMAIA